MVILHLKECGKGGLAGNLMHCYYGNLVIAPDNKFINVHKWLLAHHLVCWVGLLNRLGVANLLKAQRDCN